MRCKECESEISDSDVFCPYCGISLRAEPAPAPTADDEMASTIVMPFPPKGTVDQPAVAKSPSPEPVADVAPPSQPADEPRRAFNDSMPPTVPDISVNDIPTPAILSEELTPGVSDREISQQT